MSFRKTLGAGLVVSLISFGIGCSRNNHSNNTPPKKDKVEIAVAVEPKKFQDVFDSKTQTFNQLDGGIDEKYLTKFLAGDSKDNHSILFYQKVDERERSHKFIPLEKFEGSISNIESLITAIDNFKLIKKVDRAKLSALPKEHIPLKVLLNKLNRINRKRISRQEKVRRLHDTISDSIESGEETSESVSLEKLVQGVKGDCNDLSPAFFSLLNYYGIKTYLRCGKVIEKGEEGLHEWVGVEIDNVYFDLDPTWYGTFCPLEDRNEKIEHTSLKDEYMVFKKNKQSP